jgi:hypothetical protein
MYVAVMFFLLNNLCCYCKSLLKFACFGFHLQTLFSVNPCQHPIVILKDVKYSDLKTMVDFMYYGEVNVSQEQLPAILKVLLKYW